jgi:hypothetical protein
MFGTTKEQRFRKIADIAFEVLNAQRIFVSKETFLIEVDPGAGTRDRRS